MESDGPKVRCGMHGEQDIAVVCAHIGDGLLGGMTPGFVIAPEGDEYLPNAWCDDCETMVIALGGDWSAEARDRAGFRLLCAGCYGEAKGLAIADNRFRNLRAPM